MKIKFRKSFVLLMMVLICFGFLCGFSSNVNAASTSKYDSMTFGEIEQIFLKYLEDNNIDMEVGTQEYTDYIFEEMTGEGDAKLKEHKDYFGITGYFAKYICNLDVLQSTPGWSATKQISTDAFKNKTIRQEREENLQKDALLKKMEKQNPDMQINLSGYTPSKAVKYAYEWVKSRNPDYPNYSNDCTNFVSQCLFNGGVAKTKPSSLPAGTYETKDYWYCEKFPAEFVWRVSTPWIRISGNNNFHDYWAPRVPDGNYASHTTVSNYGQVGDVVLWRHAGTLNRFHTTIITKKSNGIVYLTYHSNDTKDKPINELNNDDTVDWSLLDF